MPDMSAVGVLRPGWRAAADEHPMGLAWAPDGKLLFVLDAQGTLAALDSATGKPRWKVRAHPGGLALAPHPKSAIVATVGLDGAVALWRAHDGSAISREVLSKGWAEHVAWSPDGEHLAVAAGRVVRVWSGDDSWDAPSQASTVSAIAWTAQGELATARYGGVNFWRPGQDQPTQALEWKGSMLSMVISPDGEIVACGSQDRTVHFWRRTTGDDSTMGGYSTKPTALSFDPSGSLLATSGSEVVTVWSFQDGGPEGTSPAELEAHTEPVTTVVFSPSGAILASGARDGGVALWSAKNGKVVLVGGAETDAAIVALSWRPDQRALTAADAKGNLFNWRVAS
jgi:WD40 repeat protein